MHDPELEQLERMRPSERLRLWAEMGAKVRRCGTVESDFNDFAERIISSNYLPRSFSADENPETLRERLHVLHSSGTWAHYGFNVFDLSPDLAAGFLLTEPAPLKEELKLPFPCFFIKLTEGIVPIFADGQQRWAEGIWVHRFTSQHRKGGTRTAFLRWTVISGTLSLWKDRFPTDLDDPNDESMYNLVWQGDPPCVPEDQISTDKALRIIKNLISWLDATGGLAVHPKPQPPHIKRKASKEKRKQLNEDSWPRIWIFGQNVKLQPELKMIAREFALSQSKKHAIQGWKVRSKHVVRGHWKNQPHGEQRTLRKLIWIEPHYRGEGNVAWAHLYTKDLTTGP